LRSLRERFLGRWEIFCDIAGQVSRSPENEIVTVAATAIPSEIDKSLRRTLTRVFNGKPVKFKHGRLEGLRKVVDVICAFRIPTAVVELHIADRARWKQFYEDADNFVREAQDVSNVSLPFASGDMAMRMQLLGRCQAGLSGGLLRLRRHKRGETAVIELAVCVDTDIRGDETVAQFVETMEQWQHTTRLPAELGVTPKILGTRCVTEQAEPLLLLPDYVAGMYHHADPRTSLSAPVVTREEASKLVEALRQRLRNGIALFETTPEFSIGYPLRHDKNGDTQIRADSLPSEGEE
jgi:hypothetical protein